MVKFLKKITINSINQKKIEEDKISNIKKIPTTLDNGNQNKNQNQNEETFINDILEKEKVSSNNNDQKKRKK